jgi:hypothetical protein
MASIRTREIPPASRIREKTHALAITKKMQSIPDSNAMAGNFE